MMFSWLSTSRSARAVPFSPSRVTVKRLQPSWQCTKYWLRLREPALVVGQHDNHSLWKNNPFISLSYGCMAFVLCLICSGKCIWK